MSEPNLAGPGAAPGPHPKRQSLLKRLTSAIRPTDAMDLDDVKAVLDTAHLQRVLDDESYRMMAGALDVTQQTAADIMVPRSRIDMLDISRPLSELLPEIIETGHSRFPVYEDDRDNIVGILLAKDLLLTLTNPDVDLRSLVRPAVFIPETKRLNLLLRDFRSGRNHLAIVIDEHGGASGLVTMEDVLEEIVGEIEDEYDEEEKTIFQTGPQNWRLMGVTEIADFNTQFGTHLADDDYDTVGGWLAAELGHIPRRGETLSHEGLQITVVGADGKRALWLHVQRNPAPQPESPGDGPIIDA